MTFEEYVAQSIKRQEAVIRREEARMRKADALWLEYAADMAKLDLHPLTFLEIGDRRSELKRMRDSVHDSHGATETMKALWEASFGEKRRRQK